MDVIRLCRELLRIDTSNPGQTEEVAARYVVDTLAHAGIATEVVESHPGRCSVISRHRGLDGSLPGLLVHGHLDVVPAQEGGWRHDPFGGIEADGCLWGRGAVDMKNVVAMMLATQVTLATSGVSPQRDLTFAYFADEEQGGTLGSAWLTEHRPDLFEGVAEAVGELGGFAVTLPNGRRIYPLQCAEKGMLWVRVLATGPGGHAAFSEALNPTVLLALATQRLANLRTDDPPPDAFGLLVEGISALLGDDASDPVELLSRLGSFGEMSLKAARTTFVPTVARAGTKINVIPAVAELFVDCRFVPGGLENALAALHATLGDDLEYEILTTTPGLAAPADGPLAAACQAAVDGVDPGATVVPWALAAGTDGQRLASLGIASYGFAPLVLPAGFDYPALFHAVDERVPVAALRSGSEILTRLVSTY